jgi:hypothetical protein
MLGRLLRRMRGAGGPTAPETAPDRADSRQDFVDRFRAAVQEVSERDILTQLSAGYGVKSAVGAFQDRFGDLDGFLAASVADRRAYLDELAEEKRQMTENGQVEAVGHGLFKTALTPMAAETPDRTLFRECMEILALLSPKATELIPRSASKSDATSS